MCIMVVSSLERFGAIVGTLDGVDVSQIHFYNSGTRAGIGTPSVSLVPFANLVVCEDAVFDSPGFRDGPVHAEAERLSIPVLSESGLRRVLEG